MATKFEPIRTKVTPAQMAEALRKAWRAQFGGEPRPTSLALLLAQWAFETGRGQKMYNYNLGNAKAKPGGTIGWTFFECDEILPHAAAQECAATGGDLVTVTPYDATHSRVVFRPEHPACCFRAFATLDEGCADYLTLLCGRFASAWPAVEHGDPPLFAHLLKQARYYTAPEGHYASSITSLFFEFWPLCHPGAIDVREVKGQQRVLLALGYELGPSGADGKAGKRTIAAVKAFQQARGLAADGKVGTQTKLALIHALEARLLAATHEPAPQPEYAPAPRSVPVAGPTIPERPAGAPTGSQFLAQTASLSRAAREQAIAEQLLAGNVPSFYRAFKPVCVNGGPHALTFRVAPDYLAIGSDDDYVRIPMSPLTAQRVADAFGCSLPTRKMVDQTFAAAEVKVEPAPLPPTPRMMSNDYYRRHNGKIEATLPPGARGRLIAGDKKDVVLSNALARRPGKVAIYGWHHQNGKPIQPLSTVHENTYADYSHGARLISRTVDLDGQAHDLDEVLTSPELASLLSDEGPLAVTRVPGA